MSWERVKELFAEALERDAAARAAFLDEACAGDAELRAEIDSLLSSHDTSDDFIEKPAVHRALGLEEQPEPPAWIGRRVGDYRLVEEVGRGGMSEVYKAVRDDDEYHKDVAVKVLRKGYETRSLLKRFKVETQILATLDHPNIARLLDAGSTEEGLPYLVMDYIQGRPIDEYCSLHRLSIAQRLQLFRTLCAAVQYVHQHLMVHGDLKCSNVLVADGGTVKLLDFGIARLLNPRPGLNLPDQKLTGLVALTPEFASPEQVRGGPITTASDVYSLGVVLYRLLTGVLPYRLKGDFSYELAKQILERDATPPSLAAREHESSETLGFSRQLRGDLDDIVLMALEKDPAKRYPSVERFDEDLRRHLEGFPVTARSSGYLYQLGKFIGRHQAGIIAAGVLVATLIGGIITTSWQARIALAQRERAERHFNEVRKLANVFMFDVHEAIADLPGSTSARKLLVDNSLRYIEALSAESANEPSLQRELASAYEKVADVQGGFRSANLGDTEGALSSYRKALAIRQRLFDANPADRDVRRELLRNYGKLGDMLAGEGDARGAIDASRQAATHARSLAAAANATVEDRRNMATAYQSLGWQLASASTLGDGLLFMKQAVAMYESLLADQPADLSTRRLLALAYSRMADLLLDYTATRDNINEALRMHEKGYDIGRSMAEAEPLNTRLRKMTAYSLLGMGDALTRLGKPRAALEKQLAAVTTLRETLDSDPKNETARFDAALALGKASASYLALGEPGPAERRLADAMAILARSAGITEAGLSDMKVLLGMDHVLLAQANVLRAAQPELPSGRRAYFCKEAERWLALSRPVLTEAESDPKWRYVLRGLPTHPAAGSDACPQVVTAAK